MIGSRLRRRAKARLVSSFPFIHFLRLGRHVKTDNRHDVSGWLFVLEGISSSRIFEEFNPFLFMMSLVPSYLHLAKREDRETYLLLLGFTDHRTNTSTLRGRFRLANPCSHLYDRLSRMIPVSSGLLLSEVWCARSSISCYNFSTGRDDELCPHIILPAAIFLIIYLFASGYDSLYNISEYNKI